MSGIIHDLSSPAQPVGVPRWMTSLQGSPAATGAVWPAGRSINKVCRHLASWVMWLQLSQENQCLHNRSEDCGGQPAALLGLHQIGRRGRQAGEEREEMSHRLREDDQGGNLFWSDDDHYFTSHILSYLYPPSAGEKCSLLCRR